MFRWLTRKKQATTKADYDELTRRLYALEARTRDLEQDRGDQAQRVDRLLQRIYAVLGRRGIRVAEEAQAATGDFDWQTCDLTDPRLTKAQVKQRLQLLTAAGQARRIKTN